MTDQFYRLLKRSINPKKPAAPYMSQESREPEIVQVQVGPKLKCTPKNKRPARKARHL